MKHMDTVGPRLPVHKHESVHRPAGTIVALIAAAIGFIAPLPARAVDGCLVLLCFAAPDWRAIAQCVPPIRQVLVDLAHGRPFPSCGMAGAGNSASNVWANVPSFCPPQYTSVFYGESAPIYSCDYLDAVSVSINGALFSRTWWNMGGGTVTEFSPAAKAQLGIWNTRFDDDYAAWLAMQTPPPIDSRP